MSRVKNKDNLLATAYGSIYKTSGGSITGKKQYGGQNVNSWVKKILGNRIFDLYLKYLGVKTLTTASLVPFGLILSAKWVENMIKNKQTGGIISKKLPLVDHPLIGNYLKLLGISIIDLNPSTLLPLGVVMIISDIYLKNKGQKGGGSSILGNNIPSGSLRNLSLSFRGLDPHATPFQSVQSWVPSQLQGGPASNIQTVCGGNCGTNVYSSNFQNTNKNIPVNGFPTQGIKTSNTANKWVGDIGSHKIRNIPSTMAGGKRRSRKRRKSKKKKKKSKKRSQRGRGSAWMATQYSRGPVNTPSMPKNQFRAFNKTSPYADANLQSGSGSAYAYIFNPKTGRNVKSTGKTGLAIIKKYLQKGGY
jgi:hypothetical protein